MHPENKPRWSVCFKYIDAPVKWAKDGFSNIRCLDSQGFSSWHDFQSPCSSPTPPTGDLDYYIRRVPRGGNARDPWQTGSKLWLKASSKVPPAINTLREYARPLTSSTGQDWKGFILTITGLNLYTKLIAKDEFSFIACVLSIWPWAIGYSPPWWCKIEAFRIQLFHLKIKQWEPQFLSCLLVNSPRFSCTVILHLLVCLQCA